MNTIRVSNSLNPDQARRFVEPVLGPNRLQRLSADDPSRKQDIFAFIRDKRRDDKIVRPPNKIPDFFLRAVTHDSAHYTHFFNSVILFLMKIYFVWFMLYFRK